MNIEEPLMAGILRLIEKVQDQSRKAPVLSFIVPAYNEEKCIHYSVEEIMRYIYRRSINAECIVVNDGSGDETATILKSLARRYPGLRIQHHKNNKGKGAAVRTGIQQAKGDYILFLDADGSTPLSETDKIIKELVGGFEVVMGSRYIQGSDMQIRQSARRQFVSRCFNKIVQVILTPGIQDTQCGFKGFTRDAALYLASKQTIAGWGFDVEYLVMAQKKGYRTKEVPIQWSNATIRKSRFGSLNSLYTMARDVMVIYRNKLKGRYG